MKKKVLFIIVSIVLLIGFTSCDPIAQSIAAGTEALDPATDPQVHEKYFKINEQGTASLKEGQTSLPTSLLIPEKVGEVKVKAIAGCTGDFETVRIPGHVETICEEAFISCEKLKTVVIEDGVKEIKEDAFIDCDNLTRVVINASQTKITISDQAFSYSPTTEYWHGTHQCANLQELVDRLEEL